MFEVFDPWQSAAVAADVAAATFASAAQLEARRAMRLRRLLEVAVERSPLYREWLGPQGARAALEDLPVVRKAELMTRFDDWVTDPALRIDELRRFIDDPANIARPYLGRYLVWESSGSSGQPGVFVQDAAAMAVYDALQTLRRPQTRPLARAIDPGYWGERIAFVGATGGHFASIVAATRLRALNPAFKTALHTVSFMQPLPALVRAIDDIAPTILTTYPSTALLLAQEHAAGRLAACPGEVWTGGETLTPAVRRFITETFGCAVVDTYGASECFVLASECRCGAMHLNSDWVILEPVDERGRPVPAGEPGASVLLTNLANHVQPLLRYDLGDRVRLRTEGCACGSALPLIELEGRCDDTLVVRPPGAAPVTLVPLALTTVLEEDARLFDFQLRQTGPATLRLSTAARDDAAREALARGARALRGFLQAQGAGAVRVSTRSGVQPPPGRSGKTRRVVALAETP